MKQFAIHPSTYSGNCTTKAPPPTVQKQTNGTQNSIIFCDEKKRRLEKNYIMYFSGSELCGKSLFSFQNDSPDSPLSTRSLSLTLSLYSPARLGTRKVDFPSSSRVRMEHDTHKMFLIQNSYFYSSLSFFAPIWWSAFVLAQVGAERTIFFEWLFSFRFDWLIKVHLAWPTLHDFRSTNTNLSAHCKCSPKMRPNNYRIHFSFSDE